MEKKRRYCSYNVFHKLTPLMMRDEFFNLNFLKLIINNSMVESE